jgi:aminoglycoside phosphotransferase family enzyme/predicted kinase
VSGRQPPLVEALLDPAVSPFVRGQAATTVELVETHISWVFLVGARVYKVKKPVNLGFLDFTTLARRRAACEDEVRLNRRLAPDVYDNVVEVTGAAQRPRLGGPGPVVEVAVAMRRLPADRMLDHLVRSRAVDPGLMEAIGTTVARFHASAETGGEIDALGRIETVARNWEENFSQTLSLPAEVLSPDDREAIVQYVRAFLARERHRFDSRVAEAHSRDGHGDLQAQHVCCTDPIRIFDCIEFNHRFRFGDTAGEIAFLAMDLERLGRPDLAVAFLNAYLEESGDYGAVPLLDFYRAYRAYVRGKVLGFQLAEHPHVAAEARAFFVLAARYVRPRRASRLLITSGVMGAGKTSVARLVAERLGAIVVRTDAVRKRLAGLALSARALHGFGEGLYTPGMSARTYAEALRIAGTILAAGWPVIVDGAFSSASERAAARALASVERVPLTILWCDAPDDVIAERLRKRATDRHEISDGREELLAMHRARYEPPDDEEGVVRIIDGATPLAPQIEALVQERFYPLGGGV